MKSKAELLAFIQSKPLMTISSVNAAGRPEAAVVGFGETDDFRLVFGTSNTSRKYQNVTRNNAVAVVIGWDNAETVQYEGEVRELAGEEAATLAELYFAKSPNARRFKDQPDTRYFVVTPQWLRYTDLKTQPWAVTELRF